MDWLRIVASVGACLQLAFAVLEIAFWGPWFVTRVAPAWVGGQTLSALTPEMRANIEWATPLGANMGVYNLALAIGLAWVAYAGDAFAGPLGIFLSIWLLLAAVAAGLTKVYGALALQGALGVALLLVSWHALKMVD